MEDPKLINETLLMEFGKVNDHQKFRLVWSEDLNEKRHGIHRKYHGPIYLGESYGVELCKKYSYISEKWVLEVYSPESLLNKEIDSDGYEPVWTLQDDQGHYLPPNLEFCEFIAKAWEFGKSGKAHKTEKQLASEEVEKFNKEVKEGEEILEEKGSSPLMSQLHDGSAVTVNKEREKEN